MRKSIATVFLAVPLGCLPLNAQGSYGETVFERASGIGANDVVNLGALALVPGAYTLVVEQIGIDLQVECQRPRQAPVTVNTLSERDEPEILWFELVEADTVTCSVSAPDQAGVGGRYAARLERLASANTALSEAFAFIGAAGTEGPDPSSDARRRAIASLEQAITALQPVNETALLAATHLWLGVNHYWLLQVDAASGHFRNAIELYQGDGRVGLAARAKEHLAATIMEDRQYAEARQLYAEAFAVQIPAGLAFDAASNINNRGLLELYQDQLDHAEASFYEAAQRFAKIGAAYRQAQSLANAAQVQERRHRYLDARAIYTEAMALLPSGENRWLQAVILTNRAAVERKLGNANTALALLESASDLHDEVGDDSERAWVLSGIAAIYRSLANTARAVVMQEQAVALWRRGDEGGGLFDGLIELGADYRAMAATPGETAEAEVIHREAQTHAANPTQQTIVAIELARDAVALGRPGKARDYLEQAMRHAASNDNAHLLNVARLEFASVMTEPDIDVRPYLEAAAAYFMARDVSIHQAQAAHAVSRITYDERALEWNQQALQTLSQLRRRAANPWLTVYLAEYEYPIIERQIELLLRDGTDDKRLGQALVLAQQSRAASLVELLAEAHIELAPQVSEHLSRALSDARERFAESRLGADDDVPGAADRAQQALVDIDLARAALRAAEPRYGEIVYPEHPSLAEVQSWLATQSRATEIVYFFVGDRAGHGWRIAADRVRSWQLPGQARIIALGDALREQIALGTGGSTAALIRAARAASAALLPPAAGEFAHERVLIVPDGPLAFVPFAALLRDGEHGPQYLIEQAELRFVPSLRMLGERPDEAPASDGLLLFVGAAAGLPAVTAEFAALAKIRGEKRVQVFSAASDDTLEQLTELMPWASIVHFAAHASVDSRVPERSALALSSDPAHHLTLAALYQLGQVPAELVVLSACETALGSPVRGEGTIGLVRGFLYIGARRVVATQWRIADRAAAQFASRFYTSLDGGERSPAAALREAQLATLRESAVTRHPYYWAGYAIFEDLR